jgi:N-acetylmuramoyl-L-alanine amidase
MPVHIRRIGVAGLVAGLVSVTAIGPAAAHGTHTVQPGESVWDLARRHDVSVRAIADANGLSNTRLVQPGTTLSIPGQGGGSSAAGSAATGASTSTGGGSYTVRRGETLSHIAARQGVSVRALADANGISDVHRVRAGSRISLPTAAATTAAVGAGAPAAPGTSRGYPARLQASPQRLALIPTFERWASTYGVPVDLLMAVTWLESGWQNHVVSPVGAVGIGQIMPDTTAWMREVIIKEQLDPHDPSDNIRMSARYMRWLLDKFGGDTRLALAGYYQGAEAVRTRGVYAQTERYVADVLSFRNRHFSR